jgi:hypothetical protein
VLTARLRDARFFWDEDRSAPLESRLDKLSTILFHKKLGSYREKADRVSHLAAMIARDAFERADAVPEAEKAGRLCKADLATDMVRELTELQGTMGGIYAREDGLPETVWKAIYYHYLPIGVEADAPPTKAQLGAAAVTWAAVSLADKLDSVVGMYSAASGRPARAIRWAAAAGAGRGEDPGDLPELTGLDRSITLGRSWPGRPSRSAASARRRAAEGVPGRPARYLLEQRGHDVRAVRAVMHGTSDAEPARSAAQARSAVADGGSEALHGVRVAAEAREEHFEGRGGAGLARRWDALKEPASWRCATRWPRGALRIRWPRRAAITAGVAASRPCARGGEVFDDVMVMAEDACCARPAAAGGGAARPDSGRSRIFGDGAE